MPEHVERLVEPFCGVCAVTIAAAKAGIAERYWINDINEPLVELMKEVIEEPDRLANEYENIWSGQFQTEDHVRHFWEEREKFNNGDRAPARLLYLIARCVKGAIRYGSDGKMNQSPDKRRHGTQPSKIRKNALEISFLLKGKCEYSAVDYMEVFDAVDEKDLLYMDPPYQGTSFVADHRYYQGVLREELIEGLAKLNENNVGFLLSYDGKCGDKEYGTDIPEELGCVKKMLSAGRSSQATLLGKDEETLEALYISPAVRALLV
jgi:DNA adenine methylase